MSRFYSPYYYNKQKLNCKIIMNIFENLTAFPQFRVIFTLKKQDYSCSTVSLHKPCSVLQWSGSHLSAFFQMHDPGADSAYPGSVAGADISSGTEGGSTSAGDASGVKELSD